MNRTEELWHKWMQYAKADLALAEHCMENGAGFFHMAAFHAQQSAEKAIKALVISRNFEFRKTHDLNALLSMLESQPDFDPRLYTLAAAFDDFNINTRYPDYGLNVTMTEAGHLQKCASEIL